MARPERKNVDYFPHIISHGSKMQYLQAKYGNDGYATWFKIMEKLGRADNHYLDLKEDVKFMFLASHCLVSNDVLLEIIEFLCAADWLHKKLWKEHKVLCSPEFLASVNDAYKRRQNECIKLQAIELMYYNNPQDAELLTDKNTQRKEEKIIEDDNKEEKSKKHTTEKPKKVYSDAVISCVRNCLKSFDEHLQPKTAKEKNNWCDTIDKLNRIDNLDFPVIENIVSKIRKDDFWNKNFLSLTKLRNKNKDGIMYIVVFSEYLKSKQNGIGKDWREGAARLIEKKRREQGIID